MDLVPNHYSDKGFVIMASTTPTVRSTLSTLMSGTDRPGLRTLTAAWLAINAVNFAVWAIICVLSLHFESPWFLWSLIIPGGVLGAAWHYTDPKRAAR
jgi:hypothetical protein